MKINRQQYLQLHSACTGLQGCIQLMKCLIHSLLYQSIKYELYIYFPLKFHTFGAQFKLHRAHE